MMRSLTLDEHVADLFVDFINATIDERNDMEHYVAEFLRVQRRRWLTSPGEVMAAVVAWHMAIDFDQSENVVEFVTLMIKTIERVEVLSN